MDKIFSCPITYYPMREESRHGSQMVSQVLKGEWFYVLESNDKNWHKIKTFHDEYEGWISSRILYPISQELFVHSLDYYLKTEWKKNAEIKQKDLSIHDIALKYLNIPYLWGGRSIHGIDCSGLSQCVYLNHGIALPRDAYQQAEIGETIPFLEEVQNGDLVFFAENGNKITHVGILFWEQKQLKIIHASNEVKVENISDLGIFNEEIQDFTLKPILIKRYL